MAEFFGPPPSVTISIQGDYDLDIDDVFPDEVPDPLTLDDVVRAVRSAGSPTELIRDWHLGPLDVKVYLHWRTPDERMDQAKVWDGRVI